MAATAPTLASLSTRLAAVEASMASKEAELNTFYLLWAAGLVFLMQVKLRIPALHSTCTKTVESVALRSNV
jgi:hypothetical protein